MRWIRRLHSKNGSYRKSSRNCGGRWKHGWANAGGERYVQVLRLLETFSLAEVTAAIAQALRFPAIAFDAVKHLLLCAIEQRPPKLDLENYPHLPLTEVALTRAADYQVLLEQAR